MPITQTKQAADGMIGVPAIIVAAGFPLARRAEDFVHIQSVIRLF